MIHVNEMNHFNIYQYTLYIFEQGNSNDETHLVDIVNLIPERKNMSALQAA